jgi:hypothetical protein
MFRSRAPTSHATVGARLVAAGAKRRRAGERAARRDEMAVLRDPAGGDARRGAGGREPADDDEDGERPSPTRGRVPTRDVDHAHSHQFGRRPCRGTWIVVCFGLKPCGKGQLPSTVS